MKCFLALMLSLGLTVASALASSGLSVAEASAAEHKILIAYFSWGGTTEKIAQRIQQETGGTLFRIEPSTPYPTEYQACLDAASKKVAQKSRPAIKSQVEGMDSYDVVFVGFPIWWYNAPMIIDTFLESYDFSGKTVIPFCTSGGSPIGVAMDKIRLHCQNSTVPDGLTANSANVEAWVQKMGYGK